MRHFESWVQLQTAARWEPDMRQICRLGKAERETHLKVGNSYTCATSAGWVKKNMRHFESWEQLHMCHIFRSGTAGHEAHFESWVHIYTVHMCHNCRLRTAEHESLLKVGNSQLHMCHICRLGTAGHEAHLKVGNSFTFVTSADTEQQNMRHI
jgi:hypothetical protein